MKTKYVLLFCLFQSVSIFSQQAERDKFISDLNYTFSAGIANSSGFKSGPVFRFEADVNLLTDFSCYFAVGYAKVYQRESSVENYYSVLTTGNDSIFTGQSSVLNQKSFDMFPFSIGFKYIIFDAKCSPYLSGGLSYDFTDTKYSASETMIMTYHSMVEIPAVYKSGTNQVTVNANRSMDIGVGTIVKMTKALAVDMRFSYEYNSDIANYYSLIWGLSF
jgi:hypothetical protein